MLKQFKEEFVQHRSDFIRDMPMANGSNKMAFPMYFG